MEQGAVSTPSQDKLINIIVQDLCLSSLPNGEGEASEEPALLACCVQLLANVTGGNSSLLHTHAGM